MRGFERDDDGRDREVAALRGFVRDLMRDVVVRGRRADFVARDRCDLVSPFSRRILLTVRAATSSTRAPYRPDFLALCLMCSYCRSRFGLAPLGIGILPFPGLTARLNGTNIYP